MAISLPTLLKKAERARFGRSGKVGPELQSPQDAVPEVVLRHQNALDGEAESTGGRSVRQ